MTKIKRAILKSGYRQKWVAKKIGVHVSVLSHYSRGARTAPHDVIRKLAKLLRVPQKNLV